VHADLVRAPGHQVELQQRPLEEALPDAIAGHGRTTVGSDGHAQAGAGVTADGPSRCGELGIDDADTSRGTSCAPAGFELGLQGGWAARCGPP